MILSQFSNRIRELLRVLRASCPGNTKMKSVIQQTSGNVTTVICEDSLNRYVDMRSSIKTALDPIFWILSRTKILNLANSIKRDTHDPLISAPIGLGWYKWLRTQQIRSEFDALRDLVKKRRPAVILEIGVDCGGSFLTWAELASSVVVGIDLPPTVGFALCRRKMWSGILRTWPEREFHMIYGDSHSPVTLAILLESLAGREIDFAFIDGDHSESGVRDDWNNIRPLMNRGGIVAFHDIVPFHNESLSQVDRFWKQLRATQSVDEIIADQNQGWAGIGVVHV